MKTEGVNPDLPYDDQHLHVLGNVIQKVCSLSNIVRLKFRFNKRSCISQQMSTGVLYVSALPTSSATNVAPNFDGVVFQRLVDAAALRSTIPYVNVFGRCVVASSNRWTCWNGQAGIMVGLVLL